MGFEPDTLDDYLRQVHRVAQFAWRARKDVVKAMDRARRYGATDKQLAQVTGLSVQAVAASCSPESASGEPSGRTSEIDLRALRPVGPHRQLQAVAAYLHSSPMPLSN